MTKNIFLITEVDNVAVALNNIKKGELATNEQEIKITALEDIKINFKIAIKNISKGERVIKYGYPIGEAIDDIKAGQVVHTNNVKSLLSGKKEYDIDIKQEHSNFNLTTKTFKGYVRKNGEVGIRNEIFIIPTVGCVNEVCDRIAKDSKLKTNYNEIYVFKHPYGCSQLGDDHLNTQTILADLAKHPNAGGVLIVSLGCENNNLTEFKKVLKNYDNDRIKFLIAQESNDEIKDGINIVKELVSNCLNDKREDCSISKLKIGLKCGGSDALSGITANPLVGVVCNKLSNLGASVVMTEVPEMFGAEQILMQRSNNSDIYKKTIEMINNFKDYYTSHGEKVSENPSPGNKEGGITTLEEKSLGCIQKGGSSIITDVLKYGEKIKISGLSLLEGPGNDIVAQTALAACGVNIILFTTGRGTPLGAAVPTIKISTNSNLANKKQNWIDFDAGRLLTGSDMESLSEKLLELIIQTAEGKNTKNEINDYREIAIWKKGVTL